MSHTNLCSAIGVTLGFTFKIWRALREQAPYCRAGDFIQLTATIHCHENADGRTCWQNLTEGMK